MSDVIESGSRINIWADLTADLKTKRIQQILDAVTQALEEAGSEGEATTLIGIPFECLDGDEDEQ